MDQTFERIDATMADLRDEMRGLRADFASLRDRLVQIGFGMVGVLVTGLIAVVIALA